MLKRVRQDHPRVVRIFTGKISGVIFGRRTLSEKRPGNGNLYFFLESGVSKLTFGTYAFGHTRHTWIAWCSELPDNTFGSNLPCRCDPSAKTEGYSRRRSNSYFLLAHYYPMPRALMPLILPCPVAVTGLSGPEAVQLPKGLPRFSHRTGFPDTRMTYHDSLAILAFHFTPIHAS